MRYAPGLRCRDGTRESSQSTMTAPVLVYHPSQHSGRSLCILQATLHPRLAGPPGRQAPRVLSDGRGRDPGLVPVHPRLLSVIHPGWRVCAGARQSKPFRSGRNPTVRLAGGRNDGLAPFDGCSGGHPPRRTRRARGVWGGRGGGADPVFQRRSAIIGRPAHGRSGSDCHGPTVASRCRGRGPTVALVRRQRGASGTRAPAESPGLALWSRRRGALYSTLVPRRRHACPPVPSDPTGARAVAGVLPVRCLRPPRPSGRGRRLGRRR